MTRGELGVNQICKTLGLGKSTYYESQDPKDRLQEKYQDLKPKLENIIRKNPSYGWPRLQKALKEKYGRTVNHKLLLKLLKLWGLSFKRRIRKPKRSIVQEVLKYLQSRANLLRKAVIDRCAKAIVTDITVIPFRKGTAYLAVHMDHFGKEVYGYEVSESPDTKLVLASLGKAKKRLRELGISSFRKIIFHQDRGSVYTSRRYAEAILAIGGYLSYSKKGEPGDNAVNESFFGRFKEEWRDVLWEAESIEEVRKLVNEKIQYYNFIRYHTSLALETPHEFTKKDIRKNLSR